MAELKIAMSPEALADPRKRDLCAVVAGSFAAFVPYWKFLDQESGEVRSLGRVLWPSQRTAVKAYAGSDRIYALKARKLGLTTLECAFDAWCARFRDENARVHLYSRRDDAAMELLEAVRYGLVRLPRWMRLPIEDDTDHELTLRAGPDDRRLVKSYPASPNTAVEATCTHGHVDEWWRMPFPDKTWQAIEPSFAGSVHILTTGLGPVGYCAEFWKRSLSGDTKYRPLFIDALQRPGRSREWWAAKLREVGETLARREWPLTWQDALFGGSDFVFDGADLDFATDPENGARGPAGARARRTYSTGWDIGRHTDAAVGLVLDASEEVVDVVHGERHREASYPILQGRVKLLQETYGGSVVEANNAGEAVVENLDLPEDEVAMFQTTKRSKARILSQLQLAFQNQLIRYDKHSWPWLDAELRGYQWDDKSLVQDAVMALAIAYDNITELPKRKRRRGRIPHIARV